MKTTEKVQAIYDWSTPCIVEEEGVHEAAPPPKKSTPWRGEGLTVGSALNVAGASQSSFAQQLRE